MAEERIYTIIAQREHVEVSREVYYVDWLELEQEIIRRQFKGDMAEFDEPEEALPATDEGLGHRPMFKCQTETEEQKLPLRTD